MMMTAPHRAAPAVTTIQAPLATGPVQRSKRSAEDTKNAQATAPSKKPKPEPPHNPESEAHIDFARIRLAERIGEGSFGAVHRARIDGWYPYAVAAKRITVGQPGAEYANSVESALAVMGQEARVVTNHPNVVRFLGYSVNSTSNKAYIITDLVEGKDLAKIMFPRDPVTAPIDQSPTKDEVQRNLYPVLVGIARGMAAIHKADVIHMDLKPSNILFRAGSPHVPVICDFGLSHSASREGSRIAGSTQRGFLGTSGYAAPEALEGRFKPNDLCDVFSFGVIAYELLVGERAWGKSFVSEVEYDRALQAGLPVLPDHWDGRLKDLLTRCWMRHPTSRPSFREIVSTLEDHHWASTLASAVRRPGTMAYVPQPLAVQPMGPPAAKVRAAPAAFSGLAFAPAQAAKAPVQAAKAPSQAAKAPTVEAAGAKRAIAGVANPPANPPANATSTTTVSTTVSTAVAATVPEGGEVPANRGRESLNADEFQKLLQRL